ncbi:aldehyde dehydrogenase family protein, partial [Actinosynnema sp.]
RRFLARCSAADAVVFTGKPENATAVAARLTGDPLVLAFGSGPNPVVVGPEADLASVVADVVRVRTYNSGQDCLCPDVVMVHESVADDFVAELASAVRGLRVGRREEFDVEVAPLVYPDAVRDIADFLAAHRGAVRAGGRVRADLGFVEPTLLDLPWDPAFHPPEFFGPVFAVTRYRDVADVRRWASSPEELRRGMYLSHYGEPALTERVLGTAVTLAEQVTLDEENGNAPLGGYGLEAGHARRGAAVVARPLLLSAELGAAGLGPTASGGGREPR